METVNAVLIGVLVIITGFYAWQTYKMAKEMQKATKSQMMPCIEAKIANLQDRAADYVILRIANVGPGPAKDTHIKYRTDPAGGSDREWKPLLLFAGEHHDLKIPVGSGMGQTEMDIHKISKAI